MLGYDELKSAFRELGLANNPVIAHASLQRFGYIHNGADTVLQALTHSVQGLIMPTFTYKTMVTPEVGPPNNGITYGAEKDLNRMAKSFTHDMRADPMIGISCRKLCVIILAPNGLRIPSFHLPASMQI